MRRGRTTNGAKTMYNDCKDVYGSKALFLKTVLRALDTAVVRTMLFWKIAAYGVSFHRTAPNKGEPRDFVYNKE